MICMTAPNLDDATLDRLSQLSMSADPPPWRSMIEGRNHLSGDSHIMIGPDGDRREDLYVSRDSGAARQTHRRSICLQRRAPTCQS
jgi:hypothetical protein